MAHMFPALALAGALAGSMIISAPARAAGPAPDPVPAAFASSRFEPLAGEYHCRGRCGWRRDRRWRRDRVDAGDVLLGAVIIGGIAAILDSDNRRERDRDYDRDVVVIERDSDLRDDRDWDERNRDERDGVQWRDGGQWSDEAYGAARASVGATVPIARGSAFIPAPAPGERFAPTDSGRPGDARMPAYPGGPIPGEEIPEDPPE